MTQQTDPVEQAIDGWCLRECAHWQAAGTNPAQAGDIFRQRHENNPMAFLFQIRAGQVTIADKAPATPDRVPVWRPPLYLRFLNDVVSRFCPDLETELLINVGDGGIIRETIPVFAFQKPVGSNALLLPDVDFLEFDFYQNKPQFADDLPYETKSCAAIFVGSASGGRLEKADVLGRTLPRLRSGVFFKDNPRVDFLLPILPRSISAEARAEMEKLGFGDGRKVSYQEQFKRKFIISMDGWGATCSRLPIALRSNSVLLKYDSRHLLHYFDAMIPWVHYIPIAADEAVDDIIRAEAASPGTFAAIARQGQAFAHTYLSRETAMRYTARLLRGYAACFAAPPPPPVTLSAPAAEPPPLHIVLHVGFRGDVVARPGIWAGGAGAGQSIEGFAIHLPETLPADEIAYLAVNADGSCSEAVQGGAYCGTRGRRTPIHGIAMRTEGALARHWHCEYTARFADGSEAGPVRQGSLCKSGSFAMLTGVRIRLVPAEAPDEPDGATEELLF